MVVAVAGMLMMLMVRIIKMMRIRVIMMMISETMLMMIIFINDNNADNHDNDNYIGYDVQIIAVT